MKNKIYPCLWFNGQAKAAAELYCSVFKNSKITTDTPMVVNFELEGHKFMGLNGGPTFKINPSISFYVSCETEEEVNNIWSKLYEGGTTLLPLDTYPWSEKYGWLKDQYDVTWQITLDKNSKQKITPSMLFTEGVHGKGSEAIDFYTTLFPETAINAKAIYEEGQNNYATKGMILYSNFNLFNQAFIVMDAGMPQDYTFNEGISFVVDCENQKEVDFFWDNLTANGGQESQCGWLKDKFGVSWQIVPRELGLLMSEPDTEKTGRVMQALMLMKKIDIEKLKQASVENKTIISIKTTVNAPVEKVWKLWTEPEHIMQWNNASDDWHTPKATNDLRVGGTFSSTMAAKDGSFSFDFAGIYDVVKPLQNIEYTIADGRKVKVKFSKKGSKTQVIEDFQAESIHPNDMQKAGWQAILNNFKKYAEK